MTYGLLDVHDEEQKYPKWLQYLAILYVVVLFWTLSSIPSAIYDILMTLFVFILWIPAIILVMYILEKPSFVQNRKKAMRILFVIFTIIAIFLGILLSYTFFE